MEANEVKITKRSSSPQDRQAIIQHWKDSGKSKKEYCSENGINYYTLMSWLTPSKKHKLKQSKPEDPGERFSEIKLPTKSSEALFARISIGKTSVDLFQSVSPDYLRRLLNV